MARDIIFPYNCSPNTIVVSNGAKLTAAADNVLKLLPGFSVQAGSIFTGKITSYTEAESPCVRTSSGGRIGEDEEDASNNKKADEVFVYPNPGDGVYNVRFNFAKPGEQVRCYVTDLDGKIVFEKNFYNVKEAVEVIDILKSSSGVYLLKVVNDGKIIYRKIIKF